MREKFLERLKKISDCEWISRDSSPLIDFRIHWDYREDKENVAETIARHMEEVFLEESQNEIREMLRRALL